MGDYSSNASYPPYPPPAAYPPPPTPTPQPDQGFNWGNLIQQLSPAHLASSLIGYLVPGAQGVFNDVGAIQAAHAARTMAAYSMLSQMPSFNAMQYGAWPQVPGMPANPWPTVPASGAPGMPSSGPTSMRPEDVNRLSVGGAPPGGFAGYHPVNVPGPGMPPRVLTPTDAKTQLDMAEAEAWRRYNMGGAAGGSNIPPYAPPVVGPPGHQLWLVNQHQGSKGEWINTYSAKPPTQPATSDVAAATNPLAHPDTHGAGPPLPGDGNRNQGGPPPPTNQQGRSTPQGNALAGMALDWKSADGTVHHGIINRDGMGIQAQDGAAGIVAVQPDGSYTVIESNPGQQASGGPTSTTTVPTTTSTSTTRVIGTTTSQPPRTLPTTTSTSQPSPTTSTTLPPTPDAGGAVAGSPAQPGASSQGASPDMQRLDAIPMPSTTQTPTTTQAATTAPPTSTTETPTTTQPPTTAAPTTTQPPFPLGPPTSTSTLPPGVTPPVSNFPLGPNPPRPQPQGTVFPLGPGQPRTGSPSPAFTPPGEAAGTALGRVLGATPGTAAGAQTPAVPSIVRMIGSALAPTEAQAGGPPGGPPPGPAATSTEEQPVPDETPSEPPTVLQPAQQLNADISQAIARNTNRVQNWIRAHYPQYPKMFDIPPSIRQQDGVLVDAGRTIQAQREADMTRARAQATPEKLAQLDAANNAYNRLWLLYRTPIGAKGLTGLDASLPNPDQPGLNRFILESGPFFNELRQGGAVAKSVGDIGHAMSRSGAGIPNAPPSLESVEQMKGRGGEEGQAATNFMQGHTAAIPIARALGASGRVNQRELALIQQYLIPSADTFFDSNYQKLQNTLDVLDAIRRGYTVDPDKTRMVLKTGPDGVPHLEELGGGGTEDIQPNVAVPGIIGGGQYAPPPSPTNPRVQVR